jgi:ribonucleotide reductase alpha subunit
MVLTTASNLTGQNLEGTAKMHKQSVLTREKAKEILAIDYGPNFPESVHDVVRKLYSKRNEKGEAIETITQTWKRVALAIAVARIKYTLKLQDIIQLTLEKALENETVLTSAARYYQAMGTRKMFANTPCNINANPEISLYVLQYEAHGEVLNWSTHKIWMSEHELRQKYERLPKTEKEKVKKWLLDIKGLNHGNTYGTQQKLFYPNVVEGAKHELAMGYYASRMRRKGGLAACGVTNAGDSLEEIEKAAAEIMDATKGSMGMGINTSSLRPWQTPNSDGSTASGPDRFVEKLFCPAGQSIAQGGRRGGAFIELRDSNHPDITLFIAKKQLPKEPNFPDVYDQIESLTPKIDPKEYSDPKQYEDALMQRQLNVMLKAMEQFGKASYEYFSKQQYLKNYNISVRAVRGFMLHVEKSEWYPAFFANNSWKGNLYDFTKPVLDSSGNQKVNPLNKEPLFELYSVNLDEFPEALESVQKQGLQVFKSEDGKLIQVKEDGVFCFYAPDIFKRIAIGMINGGEPGIQFADHVEAANANKHIYELHTCNPCGEQNLPAQIGKDGLEYRGICNLTTLHASHKDFWDENGNYLWEKMEELGELATEFMDDVTTVSHFPILAQNSTARRERRNGGGFAGVAEFIARHELEFGSEEVNKIVTKLYDKLATACIRASNRLAEDRGVYEIWNGSTFALKGLKVRNCCMVNQQPTGTMAQLCGTSWGPEPFNGIVFSRKVRDAWVKFTAPGFEEAMKKRGAWPKTEKEVAELCEKISKNGKKVSGLKEVPEDVQKIFKINTEIDPLVYIEHLASIQRGVGSQPECFNALSNTCMIKSGLPWEYAWEGTMLGYKLGVKSITFYPDGTRLSQPVEEQEKRAQEIQRLAKFLPGVQFKAISASATPEDPIAQKLKTDQVKLRRRPKRLYGFNEEVLTPEGPVHVHVYFDDRGPRQVFAHLMRGGGIASGMIEAICRMATKALKWSCPPEDVANGLLNIQGGPKIVGVEASSIPDAIGKVLKEACKGQYQMSLFHEVQANGTNGIKQEQLPKEQSIPVQTTLHEKHEIKFDEKLQLFDEAVIVRMHWIAQGHETHCPCCNSEFTPDSFGNPACKSGPVCLSCGWSHCG